MKNRNFVRAENIEVLSPDWCPRQGEVFNPPCALFWLTAYLHYFAMPKTRILKEPGIILGRAGFSPGAAGTGASKSAAAR
jgi:hypothetical protein